MLSSEHPKNLEALFIRGVVNLCDHAGSAHVKLDGNSFPSVENLLQLFSFQADTLFQHQNHAGQIHYNAALIAPTGSGKTEAALMWASAQVDLERKPVFYVLPYQASL